MVAFLMLAKSAHNFMRRHQTPSQQNAEPPHPILLKPINWP
jgi:hypothetical protein